MGKTRTDYGCSLELSMDLVGGKWKMVILWRLRSVTLRFGELRHQLPGITQKMLTQQLRELEEAGLVCRKAYAVVPPRVEYSLTREGLAVIPALDALCVWADGYAGKHGIALAPRPCSSLCAGSEKTLSSTFPSD